MSAAGVPWPEPPAAAPALAADDDGFLNVTLWAAQLAVGGLLCAIGLYKLAAPLPALAQALHWPGEFPAPFTRGLGGVDLLGGLGLVLPAATRILPRLTVWAAAGVVLLQALAMGFHAWRGEWPVLGLNLLLLALAAHVAWGRGRRVVIAPLGAAAARRRALVLALWAAQLVLAAVLAGAGLAKLLLPLDELAPRMPWVAAVPPLLVRLVGGVDLAGALGVVLPTLTRVRPRLGVLAALGIVALQTSAMVLHVARGEFEVLPLNAVLWLLAAGVAWGRARVVPVAALPSAAARRRVLAVTLWTAQSVAAVVFVGAGLFKLSAPLPELVAALRWPGDLPPAVVRLIGAIDLAGGLGILLPALTRIQPRLTVLAALGCALLQALAIAFHVARGEGAVLGLNAVLLGCALLVLWGRGRAAPVRPRD